MRVLFLTQSIPTNVMKETKSKETKSKATKAATKTPKSKKTSPTAKNGSAKKRTTTAAKRKRPAAARKQPASRPKSLVAPLEPDHIAVAAYYKSQHRTSGGEHPDPIADWYDAEAELAQSFALAAGAA